VTFSRPPPDPHIGNAEKLSVFIQVKLSCPVRAAGQQRGGVLRPGGLGLVV